MLANKLIVQESTIKTQVLAVYQGHGRGVELDHIDFKMKPADGRLGVDLAAIALVSCVPNVINFPSYHCGFRPMSNSFWSSI